MNKNSHLHFIKWNGRMMPVPSPIEKPLVVFDDIHDDMTDEYQDEGWEAFACLSNNSYIGYIAYDYDMEFYMFYPVDDRQVRLTENILYNIADKLYDLNRERRLN